MEMSTTKTVAVFAVIFGCFAILYPRIFHPMLLHAFGLAPTKQHHTGDDLHSRIPPHMQRGAGAPRTGPGDDVTRHLKPGPHPGLRAAAEMRKQAATTPGTGGKGMMTFILPMYAIGIVVYLVYTLTKVFGRKENQNQDYLQGHFKDPVRYDPERKRFMPNAPVPGAAEEESDDDEEYKRFRMRKKEQRDLERLLLKADKNEISQTELSQLKRRLLDTESQMSRILSAMGTIEDKLTSTVTAEEPEPQEQPEAGGKRKPEEMGARPEVPGMVDSSPDMESYDIISAGQAESRGSGDAGNGTDEETGFVQELEQDNLNYYQDGAQEVRAEERKAAAGASGGEIGVEDITHRHELQNNEAEEEEGEDDYDDDADDVTGSEEDSEPHEELIETEEDSEEEEQHPDLRCRKVQNKPDGNDSRD